MNNIVIKLRNSNKNKILRFNENHDSKTGQFTDGHGGSSSNNDWKKKLKKDKDRDYYENYGYDEKAYLLEKKKKTKLEKAKTKEDYLRESHNYYDEFQDGTANQDNFFGNTIAEFNDCERPNRKPDYISYTRSGAISSEYWYTKKGVVRSSDHWGKGVASCDWYLKSQDGNLKDLDIGKERCGKASWKDFLQKTQTVNNYFKLLKSGLSEDEAHSGGKIKTTISTFSNTIGIKKGYAGTAFPKVKDYNDYN